MVKRYRAVFLEMQPFNTGAWVRFTDHKSELTALRQRIKELKQADAAAKHDIERLLEVNAEYLAENERLREALRRIEANPVSFSYAAAEIARAALGRKA